MEVSVAFPTTLDSHDDIALAEELGYERAWLYDTPQNSPDVWMTLALAAERTTRIGLGPGVLVPVAAPPDGERRRDSRPRRPGPGAGAVGFGTGFSGRRAMGYRGITWAYMADYIRAYRGLLRGEVVEWEGAEMQMLHPDGHAPARPVNVPVLISALGPMGAEVAGELGDGLYATLQLPEFAREFATVSYLAWGTVLDEGEDPTSERVRLAGGPGTALAWHGAYEFGGHAAVADLPGGEAWNDVVNRTRRNRGTSPCTRVTASSSTTPTRRRGTPAATPLLRTVTLSGTRERVGASLRELADGGQPRGEGDQHTTGAQTQQGQADHEIGEVVEELEGNDAGEADFEQERRAADREDLDEVLRPSGVSTPQTRHERTRILVPSRPSTIPGEPTGSARSRPAATLGCARVPDDPRGAGARPATVYRCSGATRRGARSGRDHAGSRVERRLRVDQPGTATGGVRSPAYGEPSAESHSPGS